ncbi:MAG: glycosyltransferase family 4 protein [Gemmataceae bacterium]|nr:glycosyltransferase family 4 protein [Gemmataceae bacterium]MCI0739843.1 glycosyltransferase family 4 protein [Gemmataceae bacterium]
MPSTPIYINGRFLSQPLSGVQRYARELLAALDELLPSNYSGAAPILLLPRNATPDPKLQVIPQRVVGRWTGQAWEQLELTWHSRDGLLVSLCNSGPVLKARQIVTMHDASFRAVPQSYSFLFRQWYGLLLPALGACCRQVVTVSQFAKKELQRRLRIPKGKIHVVPHGGDHLRGFQPASPYPDPLPDQFVLGVGSLTPNRNFHTVAQALTLLHEPRLSLVLAGEHNPDVFGRLDFPNHERVCFLGQVADPFLPDLYSRALCLVIPSLYDSFGLPALEAMSVGCPVIASRSAALPEVCGDAALYCDPRDPQDIADKIQLLLKDEALCASLRRKGFERSAKFHWQRCALETWQLIASAAA